MSSQRASERANMPTGANKILDERTIEFDNRNLLKLLRKGMRVLDVGCGSGAITHDIAKRIAPAGFASGIDISEELINIAKEKYTDVKNISFYKGDIYNYQPTEKFQLISSARVLQWLDHPKEALVTMKSLLTDDGTISILDYNHEKIEWVPHIPETMHYFYSAFLEWRKDAGFDNAIADHLQQMFAEIGLKNIIVENQFEKTDRSEKDFARKASIWSTVAETRGKQLVKDNYITDLQRTNAITAYNDWIRQEGQSMQMYLLSVTGRLS
ncbi:MAG: class I SAM-dependent methyltransferase [Bacteroidetes bacterium]|nr:class I SAM-dependent methyltransferase [Bacteroidota bacterium]